MERHFIPFTLSFEHSFVNNRRSQNRRFWRFRTAFQFDGKTEHVCRNAVLDGAGSHQTDRWIRREGILAAVLITVIVAVIITIITFIFLIRIFFFLSLSLLD